MNTTLTVLRPFWRLDGLLSISSAKRVIGLAITSY